MKLTTRQDIEAPLEHVWSQITNFQHFEKMAMQRGADVERVDKSRENGPGTAWRIGFSYRGKARRLTLRLVDLAANSYADYALDSPSLQGTARFELLSLAPRRTRMAVVLDVRPKTLAARLVIQSLRLAKRRVQRRFDAKGAKLAQMIEERLQVSAR